MLNAPRILSSSTVKQILLAGTLPLLIQTLELESTDLVATRWISGKQTQSQLHTLLIRAQSPPKPDALEPTAALVRDTLRCAMLTDAISTPTAWVIPRSTAQL